MNANLRKEPLRRILQVRQVYGKTWIFCDAWKRILTPRPFRILFRSTFEKKCSKRFKGVNMRENGVHIGQISSSTITYTFFIHIYHHNSYRISSIQHHSKPQKVINRPRRTLLNFRRSSRTALNNIEHRHTAFGSARIILAARPLEGGLGCNYTARTAIYAPFIRASSSSPRG